MEKTIKDEAVVGFQTERIGAQASTRSGLISTLAAALHFLVHPRTREKAEASVETERTRSQERHPEAYRSPFEAGITGGFSLLMDNSNGRNRR